MAVGRHRTASGCMIENLPRMVVDRVRLSKPAGNLAQDYDIFHRYLRLRHRAQLRDHRSESLRDFSSTSVVFVAVSHADRPA